MVEFTVKITIRWWFKPVAFSIAGMMHAQLISPDRAADWVRRIGVRAMRINGKRFNKKKRNDA